MSWIPLLLFLAFAAVNAGRILRHRQVTGINPYVLTNDDSPEGYIGRALRWIIGGLFVALAGHAAGWDSSLGLLPWADASAAFWLGTALVVVALIWSAMAQAHMGSSWRIGIDHAHPTTLIQHGLFTISRNPIFLGVRVALLGAVLLVPNAIALSTALAAEVLIQLQVRLEETHLRAQHGDDYTGYARSVHRWLGVSRLVKQDGRAST